MANQPKPSDFIAPLVYFLVLIGCLIFLSGIISAGIASLNCFKAVPCCEECLKQKNPLFTVIPLISSISIVLATNFGAVLGISLISGNNGKGPALNFKRMFSPSRDANGNIVYSEWFKVLACYIYILGLLSAFIFSIILKDSCSVPVIPDLTKSFYGFIVGAITVFLGIPPANSTRDNS